MKRTIVVSLCLLLLASCGGKSSPEMTELQKTNADLVRRVKTLEDDNLEMNKKLIQHQQALEAMHERLRDMEVVVQKLQLMPQR
jgi:TolA-binding protein